MSIFDAIVYAVAVIATIKGFKAGLLRSLATIFGYLIAAPIAVAITPHLSALLPEQSAAPPNRTWLVLAAVFLAIGIAVGTLLRRRWANLPGRRSASPIDWRGPCSAQFASALSQCWSWWSSTASFPPTDNPRSWPILSCGHICPRPDKGA